MKFILIVAVGKHREIGANNDLLWHLPRDMRFFKETTMGHTVVMGRKNWESIPTKFRPLPGRKNIVITQNKEYQADGASVIHNLDEIKRQLSKEEKTCFIIGGAQIYELALQKNIIDEMYITHVHQTFENADAFFPFVNWDKWKEEDVLHHEKDEKNAYSFTVKKYSK